MEANQLCASICFSSTSVNIQKVSKNMNQNLLVMIRAPILLAVRLKGINVVEYCKSIGVNFLEVGGQ